MFVYNSNKSIILLVLLSFPVLSKDGTEVFSHGELAQLARASALQAEGQGFEPPILHFSGTVAQLVRAPL